MAAQPSQDGFQDTRIGLFPADWDVVRLGDVTSEITDRNGDREFCRADVLAVDNRVGLTRSDKKLGKDFARYKIIGENDFAYNPMRLNVGSIGIWPTLGRALVSPDYVAFRCNPQRIDPSFVDQFRKSLGWQKQIQQSGQGSVRIRYYYRHIAEFLLPLPPLQEQRAIVHVLRTVHRAKEKTWKVIAAARAFRRSLMRHLFTYGPVPFEQADHVQLKEVEFGPLPEDWLLDTFGERVSVKSGQVDPREQPYSGMLHIGPENIEEASGRLLPCKTAEELKLKSGKYLFTSDDVIYSKIRPYLRKAALPHFGGVCSADMYPLRPADGSMCREFLYSWLLSDGFTKQAVSYQSRTGIPKINRQQLGSTLIPMPSLSEQRAIAEHLMAVERTLQGEHKRICGLDALYTSLLHNLMTGKVRVHDLDLLTAAEAV